MTTLPGTGTGPRRSDAPRHLQVCGRRTASGGHRGAHRPLRPEPQRDPPAPREARGCRPRLRGSRAELGTWTAEARVRDEPCRGEPVGGHGSVRTVECVARRDPANRRRCLRRRQTLGAAVSSQNRRGRRSRRCRCRRDGAAGLRTGDPKRAAHRVDVVLRNCPFESAVLADPDTICDLHLGIAEGVAELAGEQIVVDELIANDPRRAGCRLRMHLEPTNED